ncbi:hypothetical protein X975_16871, partial [Stegodyphus mimosarum]
MKVFTFLQSTRMAEGLISSLIFEERKVALCYKIT